MPKELSLEKISLEMLRNLWTTEQLPYEVYTEELNRRQEVAGVDPTAPAKTVPVVALPDGWRLAPSEPIRKWFEGTFPISGYARNDPSAKRAYDATIDLRMDEYRLLMKTAPEPTRED